MEIKQNLEESENAKNAVDSNEGDVSVVSLQHTQGPQHATPVVVKSTWLDAIFRLIGFKSKKARKDKDTVRELGTLISK